jgi:hypothetical protein
MRCPVIESTRMWFNRGQRKGQYQFLQFDSPRSGRSFGFPQLMDFGARDRRGPGAKSRDHVV